MASLPTQLPHAGFAVTFTSDKIICVSTHWAETVCDKNIACSLQYEYSNALYSRNFKWVYQVDSVLD